ncbi:MAG TPA: tetratricopeptide repeat protein, partial [Gemmatimonadaceae bacterium]
MSCWKVLAPVAALALTGCLASQGDVVQLQDEIRTLRAMQARSDSARRAVADSNIMLAARANDSLRALSQRFSAFQANVGGELFEIGRQLITIQELTGMSSKSLMQVRSALEERQQSMAGTDTSGAPPAPGPAQLFSSSYDQYRRGGLGAARAGFDELLRKYPDFDQASAAQLHIGEILDSEKKPAEADSVYLLVVSKYPKSNDAPTALFKFGVSRQNQGKTADARDAFQRVIREFPRSTEA